MSSVDIVIILILLWGAYRGWKAGMVKEIFSTCGFAVGLVAACLLYKTVGEHLSPAFGSGSMASYGGCVLAFILIWVVVPILFGVLANVLTKTVKVFCLGPVNKIVGLLIGAAKYFALMSLAYSAMAYVGIISPEKKAASAFYPYITVIGNQVFGDKTLAEKDAEENEKTVIITFDRDKDKKDATNRGE